MSVLDDFEFEALDAPAIVAPIGAHIRAHSPAAEVLEEIARARAEVDDVRAAAQAEGLAAGRDEALAAVTPGVQALAAAAAAVHEEALVAADQLEHRAAALAIAIAEKVLAGALEARPQLVVDSVRGALRGIVERERITVLVNPADLETVNGAIDGMRAELGGIDHFDVQAERRVGRGGCVVRHAHGDVDARIESKLERAREIVFEALDQHAEDER